MNIEAQFSTLAFSKTGLSIPDSAPVSLSEDKTYTVSVEMLRTGVFKHPAYGVVDISKQMLEEIIRNYENKVYPTDISFDADHDPTKYGALAWLAEENPLSIKAKKYRTADGQTKVCHVLVGQLVLNPTGYELVKSKRYRYFSIEMRHNYRPYEMTKSVQETAGKKEEVYIESPSCGTVMMSGGLTNRPFIPNLEPIKLSWNAYDSTADVHELHEPLDQLESDEFVVFSKTDQDEDLDLENFYTLEDLPQELKDLDLDSDEDVFAQEFARTLESINMTPPESVAKAARRGLELRKKYGRGGTAVGVARARDLANRNSLSPSTIARMVSFFARHGSNEGKNKQDNGEPSNHFIAWLLWGSNAGRSWANKVWRQIQAARGKKMSEPLDNPTSTLLSEQPESKKDSQEENPKMDKKKEKMSKYKAMDKEEKQKCAAKMKMRKYADESDEEYESRCAEAYADMEEEDEKHMDKEDKDKEDKDKQKHSYTGATMKFSDVLNAIERLPLNEQVSYLEGCSHSFSDTAESAVFSVVLKSKRDMLALDKASKDALHRESLAKKKAQELEAQAASLLIKVEEAKQASYETRVAKFCDDLRAKNHHESLIKRAEKTLLAVKPSSRDQKFSIVQDDKDQDLDVISLFSDLLSALPQDALLNTSEANTTEIRVDKTPAASTAAADAAPTVPANIQKYWDNYSEFAQEYYSELGVKTVQDMMKDHPVLNHLRSRIAEDGEIDSSN
jgi:hypothetical protein